MANDQNPYQSALIATASAQAEAKRNLDVSQTAAAAYPSNSDYQTQLVLNQQQYAATQQAYATAQTNFNSANAPIVALNSQGVDTGINGDTRTIGQTQATPVNPLNITNDDNGYALPTNSAGVGAGTTGNAATSRGDDNNPGLQNPKPGSSNTQQIVSQTFGNGVQNATIIAQPNVLDQYASYTYALSWYLLSPSQYNSFTLSEPFNTTNWKLLMQSGGAPATGRDQYFPIDYYMDDLEIDSLIPMGGTGLPYSAMSLKWKVIEPNGITLIQKLADAVHTLYKNPTAPTNNATGTATQSTANQSSQRPKKKSAMHRKYTTTHTIAEILNRL